MSLFGKNTFKGGYLIMTRSEYVEDFYKRDIGSKIKTNQNHKEIEMFYLIIIPSLIGSILASRYINKNK